MWFCVTKMLFNINTISFEDVGVTTWCLVKIRCISSSFSSNSRSINTQSFFIINHKNIHPIDSIDWYNLQCIILNEKQWMKLHLILSIWLFVLNHYRIWNNQFIGSVHRHLEWSSQIKLMISTVWLAYLWSYTTTIWLLAPVLENFHKNFGLLYSENDENFMQSYSTINCCF